MDFRETEAGSHVLALMHRKNLLRFKLHYRIPAPATGRSHDAEQLDRNPSRRGSVLVAIHAAEYQAGGRQTACARGGDVGSRLRARGKPYPGPVREHQAKHGHRRKCQR